MGKNGSARPVFDFAPGEVWLLMPRVKPLRPIPPLAACLLLVVLTLGIYWSVTGHDFVDYDDGDYVKGNSQVQAGLSAAGVQWAFTTGHASNWHPLTWLSHMLDVSLFGPKAGGHHLTSLIIHCANSVLVFLLLRALTGASWGCFIVASLFAWHPLHVESVAWVSERKDVLSAFFALLSLWAYAEYVKRRSVAVGGKARRWFVISLAFLVLGLLSKPMLVTLPCVMLLLDYWPLGRVPAETGATAARFKGFFRLAVEKLPFFALSLASSIVTFLVQRKGGAVSPLESLPVGARLANAAMSYARYLRKTFWPDDLSVLYPHPGHWPASQVIGATALLLVLTLAAFLLRKRMPYVFVGWLWFVGMLVPVIGLVQVGIQSMADRYTYLPLLGIFLALVWSGAASVERWMVLHLPVSIVAGMAVGGCAVLTVNQVGIWTNSEALFGHAVRVTEKNYLAYNNLGFYLSSQGRTAEALTNYEASLRINPNYADAHNNLGHALAQRKQYAEAIVHYRVGLRTAPENTEIHNNLGNALSESGELDAAMAEYRFVLKRNPKHADAHNNLGIALAMRGKLDEAMEHFNLALRYKPADAGAHGNLGNAFAALRKWDEATAHYREALKLSPNDAQTRNNLGNVLAEQGRLEEAATNYVAALRLKTDNPEAHFNYGCVLVRLGRRNEAAEQFNRALQLKPDYAAAREQLRALNAAPP